MPLDVAAVLSELTLEEKASLTSGSGFWYTTPVERLGIPRIMVSDGPHGLRAQPSEGDHLGLGGSLPATCFPTASAIASTWNPELLGRIGAALAQEARAINLSVILGPGINMKRSPLCGRNFEYFSEDPFLAGELGVGIVDGIQAHGVGTSVKHFAANNQETDRQRVDAQIDERTLREIYLPAFERVVTACRPWTVMCSYNKINGTSASENPWLLTTVLREEWGFDGLVVSDWGAVYHRVPALAAGLDLEMPPNLPRSPDQIVAAVRSGALDESVLDARVATVLELVAKGMPVLDLDETFDADAHHRLARAAAGESVVLLKNDGLLPLAPTSRVAVIGEFARTPRFQGAGSSQVVPTRVENALDELRAVFAEVTFAAGYGGDDDALRAEAVEAAAAADAVVMLIGLFIGYRGYDKAGVVVAFPFGFGLSYTGFALSDLRVSTSGSVAEGTLAAEVTVSVTNTGAVAGAEVVQVYVRDVDAAVARPVRELKGFAKVALDPGECRPVTVTLDQRAFSFWSELLGRWVVEAGEFAVEVGHHSRDLPLHRTVTVDAPSIAAPITAGSTLHEWMADPTAAALIAEAAAAGQPDPTRDEELVAVIGSMPMSSLAGFQGMSLDHDTLDKLVERWRDLTAQR